MLWGSRDIFGKYSAPALIVTEIMLSLISRVCLRSLHYSNITIFFVKKCQETASVFESHNMSSQEPRTKFRSGSSKKKLAPNSCKNRLRGKNKMSFLQNLWCVSHLPNFFFSISSKQNSGAICNYALYSMHVFKCLINLTKHFYSCPNEPRNTTPFSPSTLLLNFSSAVHAQICLGVSFAAFDFNWSLGK